MNFKLSPGQYLATPTTYLSDVNAIGLDVAHDLTFMQSWYWDLDDKTREFAKRSTPAADVCRTTTRSLSILRCAIYLEAVAKAEIDDAASVMKAMREARIHDIFTANGTIRADGRVLYDRYLMRVKSPAESKYPWDYLTVVTRRPAADAFRPPGAGGCKLATP
jgi:branched-chain amino acid transport system substrate-binding protein